jgi:predicted phage terminase large subunit-like protein
MSSNTDTEFVLTRKDKEKTRDKAVQQALQDPYAAIRNLGGLSLFEFLKVFWDQVSEDEFKPNWHIPYLCSNLEKIARDVRDQKPREYDLIINIPPGTTKTIVCSIMFPVWCWAEVGHWMRFICSSYSAALSLESAEKSRDIIRSAKFNAIYPELHIKDDKDTKSNFRIVKKEQVHRGQIPRIHLGGNRFSTSVGGTLIGFHGHILVVDDPLNPNQAASDIELENANRWMEQTLPTRKTDKAVTATVIVMQRLHQDDPSGHILAKQKSNVKHICLPGEIRHYAEQLAPAELKENYIDDLLDPIRMPWSVLKDLQADLGQYGYAGQIGQNPTPPGGGMFQVDNFIMVATMPHPNTIVRTVRYWDKAATLEQDSAYTVGVKMHLLKGGYYLVEDVKRGRWRADDRERIVRKTAEVDGKDCLVCVEQEGGSGGKESADNTVRNLAGYRVYKDRPTGKKEDRADPFSVQVNEGNVRLLVGEWNYEYIQEHRFFPYSTYKDQVDASSGAFNRLVTKKIARRIV